MLKAPQRDDRRVRFAHVGVVPSSSAGEIRLVTDAQGRLRYPLPAGEYRLRLGDGAETRFSLEGLRWTLVRRGLA
jgi:hypothetical protein